MTGYTPVHYAARAGYLQVPIKRIKINPSDSSSEMQGQICGGKGKSKIGKEESLSILLQTFIRQFFCLF